YVRSLSSRLKIKSDFFEEHELHVHVPSGATPKDGPSAGITIATALASLMTERLIKPYVAMTGEITLTGRVLPVGGIKEKVLAARRAGIKTVILPRDNEKDFVEDIPEDVKADLDIQLAGSVDEVFKAALEPEKVRTKTAA
ncbi:MAG: endopeptidase La, partial [Armatimonadetes bacterium]|nr:endopeptidase La [Armatimonadota bacterium]